MAGILGGDLVGMSTTLEAIAAREAGLEVLGISLVTNLAAGISPAPLNHEEVLEAGRGGRTAAARAARRARAQPVTAPMLALSPQTLLGRSPPGPRRIPTRDTRTRALELLPRPATGDASRAAAS